MPYSSVVVIHPGSLYLRIGRVSDTFPHTIPHCIARRRKSPAAGPNYEDSWLLRPEHKVTLHVSQSFSQSINQLIDFIVIQIASQLVLTDKKC